MAEFACNLESLADTIFVRLFSQKGCKNVIHWIKSLKEVGVSPDTAAQVTSQFFLTACEMVAEGDDEEGDDYEDFEE